MTTRFQYNDGGRAAAGFKGKAGDCVARAVAIASGRSYREVYEALAAGTGNQRSTRRVDRKAASARNGVTVGRKWFKEYMQSLGFRWVATMTIGQGCKVHLTADELPAGRLVVSLSKHYTAVIDGVIHDTYDPSRDNSNEIWTRALDYVLQPGERELQRYENQGVMLKQVLRPVGGRCVYGYWVLT